MITKDMVISEIINAKEDGKAIDGKRNGLSGLPVRTDGNIRAGIRNSWFGY